MASKSASRPDNVNPEFSAHDAARAKPLSAFPELAGLSKRKRGERGPQKAPTKEAVSIRLDADVVKHYRATGDGWQGRVNADLRRAAKL